MNYKNIFLIMVSLLMLVGISGFVRAGNGTITSIRERDADLSVYLDVYYLNNGTYSINITFTNINTSPALNVTGINISLPSVFTWVQGSNWTGEGVNAGSDPQFINVSDNLLRWNMTASPYVLNNTGNDTFVVSFNVTLANASGDDGVYNFTIYTEYNTSGIAADGADESYVSYIRNNITTDNTPPILASAVTHDRVSINITFTETNGILGSTLGAGDFNVSTKNYSNLAVNAASGASAGDNKTINITVAGFKNNETPYVGILSVNITDYAGNNLSAIATVLATDRIRPSLVGVGIEYNYSTKNLTLIFNEPISATINVSGVTLYNDATGASLKHTIVLNTENTSYAVYGGDQNKTVIQISDAFRDTILSWKPNAEGLNVSLTVDAVDDITGNAVNALGNQSINTYTLDTTKPSLLIIKYNHSSREMNFTFSETIDASTFNASRIFIGNQANLSMINLSNQVVVNGSVSGTNTTSIVVTLTEATAGNLSEWRADTLYIYTNNTEATAGYIINDLSGQNMTLIMNDTAIGYINSSTYTADTIAPTVAIAIVLNDTTPTKAGNVSFTITFNERMARDSTINVVLDPNESTTDYTVEGEWFNYTQWNGTYFINDNWFSAVGDGATAIKVSGATDVGGTAIVENATNIFVIDTTLPTLSMVWYNDTDFDYNESTGTESTSITNYLILKFSENVSVVSSTDANETTNIYLANETGTSYRFYGNETAGGGAIFVRDGTDRKKVNVAINNTMILWVRGKYGGYAKSHGIIVQNGSTLITDEAGNPMSNSTGVKDIYDHALTLTANGSGGISWTGFSVPHDVDSTPTWTELDKYISVVYTHTGTGWVQATSASNDFIPLRGYLMKITGATENKTIDIPLQTDTLGPVNPDNMALFTTSVSIDDGAYSLIGVNGYLDNLATDQNAASVGFLTSIGGADANNAVGSIVYADEVSTDIGTPGAMTANKLVPYRAYWIWANTKADSATYSFSGYAQSTKYPI